MPNGTPPKLEERLILFAFFNDQFGAARFADLQAALKDQAEGTDEHGRTHFYNTLKGRSGLKVSNDLLRLCDENILVDVAAINRGRTDPISLKYFQYLAALYTELYLHWRANDRKAFLKRLNDFVAEANKRMGYGQHHRPFKDEDLNKIAYWMATGSGKTLLLHLNYRQFFRYHNGPLDDVLLITPNEGLSAQHIEEMDKSSIPCTRFSETILSGLIIGRPVSVIEITKFTERKTGSGVSIEVDAFEGNNLLFVDEGHKGSGGEAWKGYRERLGAGGFTFEYSATFGQAINITQDPELLDEYSKCILFDYSYKYFYADGHGKDYAILNLRSDMADPSTGSGQATDTLLLGNLLSLYEQARVYADHRAELRSYHIEPPLWIFVGSSVNAVYSENKEKKSDVLRVVLFLRRALKNEGGWTTRTLQAILKGKSELKDDLGRDIFEGRFGYVRDLNLSPAALFRDLVEYVFHVDHQADLHLVALKSAEGEIGLKAGDADAYFGVINIGDATAFFKLAEAEGLSREADDSFSASLFDQINAPTSKVNILIGSKKFIEGWSSWRVSSMGLLNIGRGEGTQIIQLFGRGVRLLGKGHSLKRSKVLAGPHPDRLPLLETLNIFGVRANYMAQFRAYLEQEGIETEGFDEIPLPIRHSKAFLQGGLLMPRLKDGAEFDQNVFLPLTLDADITAKVDLRPQIQMLESAGVASGLIAVSDQPREIPKPLLPLLDWEKLYFAMLDYKIQKGWGNLTINKAALQAILEAKSYQLLCAESDLKPESFADLPRVETVALAILRKYAEQFYNRNRQQWESEQLEYRKLDRRDENFQDYVVRVRRSKTALIQKIHALIKVGDDLYNKEATDLPRIHFDRHLYQPLLTAQHQDITSAPPGLNDGERQFVADLREFVRSNSTIFRGKHLFLLRNLSRGRGIGFFEAANFYPDFILWIKQGSGQYIVFIDPKGLRNLGHFNEPKVQLYKTIKDIEARLGKPGVTLDSFIISVTKFAEAQPNFGDGQHLLADFEAHHVLFQEGDYIRRLFELLSVLK